MGCETWLKPGIGQGEIFPTGYNLYTKDREDGYGGVLVGITTGLNSQQIPTDTESGFIVVKVMNGNHNIIIASEGNNLKCLLS